MKKNIKQYMFYLIIIWLVVIWVYNNINKRNFKSDESKNFVNVEIWDISSSLQVLWTVKIVNNKKLTFGVNGYVTKINVKQWDFVTKWQILAELNSKDALNNIDLQKLQVSNAIINYNKLFSTIKEYQIKQAQVESDRLALSASLWDVELRQLSLEKQEIINNQQNEIQTIQDRIALNKSKIDTLKSDIEYTILSEWQVLNTAEAENNAALQMVKNNLSTIILDSKDLLANVKQMMYFDTTQKHPLELWAKDFSVRQNAENTYNIFKNTISELEGYIIQNPTDYITAKQILDKNKILLDRWMQLTNDTFNVLDASVDWVELPQSQIDLQKSTIMSLRSKFNTNITNLTNLDKQIAIAMDPELTKLNTQNVISQKEQTLKDIQNAIDLDSRLLVQAEDKIEKLYLDYDIKIKNKQNDITLQQKNAEVAKLNAISLANWPTSDEKAWASNMISQAKVSLDNASNKLEDYRISALFDGEVTAIDFDIDDYISAYDQWINIEIPWSYEIKVYLDQLDIVKIYAWQQANINLDAYPDYNFSWYVASIDPTPIIDQWIVSYKATILLDQTDKIIYNEMSATVTIIVDEKKDVLLVPSVSIINSWYDNYVELFDNGRVYLKMIKVGINNGKMVEILTWLDYWQKILSKEFEFTSTPKKDTPEWQWPDDNPGAQMRKMDEGWAR